MKWRRWAGCGGCSGALLALLSPVVVGLGLGVAVVNGDASSGTALPPFTGGGTVGEGNPVPPGNLVPIFQLAAADHRVPLTLLLGVAAEESGFDSTAASSAGALGIMQMLPATFAAYAAPGTPADAIFDPSVEVPASAAMLSANGASVSVAGISRAIGSYNPGAGRTYINQVLAREAAYQNWLDAGNQVNPPIFAVGDNFPVGQCTYYVALYRDVTWSGNAVDWFANARAQGLPTMATPMPGEIVVWAPGGRAGYSNVGHVALVIGTTATSYTVSEMNFGGFDTVDVRTVSWPDPDIEGFIG